jgi:hypothetical protein
MTVYTVHLQGDDAQAASFVPEGFAWRAFLVPPLWLLWHRLWLAFGLWCLAAAILTAAPLHISSLTKEMFFLLIAFLCGLEGQQWRRQKLIREGKPLTDVVSGDTADDAEIHFYHRWADQEPPAVAVMTAPTQTPVDLHDVAAEPAFGLFPEPEKRL